MSADDPIALAESRVALAHARLSSTVAEIQDRVSPKLLLRQAWSGVQEKSAALADDAVATAIDRPAATAGIAAGIVALVLRRPLLRLARRLRPKPRETNAADARL